MKQENFKQQQPIYNNVQYNEQALTTNFTNEELLNNDQVLNLDIKPSTHRFLFILTLTSIIFTLLFSLLGASLVATMIPTFILGIFGLMTSSASFTLIIICSLYIKDKKSLLILLIANSITTILYLLAGGICGFLIQVRFFYLSSIAFIMLSIYFGILFLMQIIPVMVLIVKLTCFNKFNKNEDNELINLILKQQEQHDNLISILNQ